jgi:ATP-dependent DNA helicase RecG
MYQMPLHATSNLMKSISNHINNHGTKIIWVTPAVHHSDSVYFAGSSAEERFEEIRKIFPEKVSLLHGGMSNIEKNDALSDIITGRKQILVTTSVIEIGIDIPDVSVCIIDRAERFGLSQLHQIRGRIGRGKKPDSGNITLVMCNDNFSVIYFVYNRNIKAMHVCIAI